MVVDQWGKYGQGRTVATAFSIGAAFGLGVGLIFLSEGWVDMGLYLVALGVFHMWEYMYVVIYHPTTISAESFMVNHSPAFNIAMGASFVEYLLESKFVPSLKGHTFVMVVGFLVLAVGQAIRMVAMNTAGRNFNHIIAEDKEDDHKLVTDGIYSIVRHPSYTGWFIWSVFTQVLLANPICVCGYAAASWMFFNDRIEYEEDTLTSHFGKAYVDYKKKVPSGIPFVK